MDPVISCFQARALLNARQNGLQTARSSLDLGLSELELRLDAQGAHAGTTGTTGTAGTTGTPITLPWDQLEEVAEAESVCYAFSDGQLTPVRSYSDESARTFQLWPTPRAPALVISGFLMHRVRDVTPEAGAAAMVRALGKVSGRLLDTTTGLGYAAIAAARIASEVVTIEVEPAVRDIARRNPWSRELFEHPRLALREGNSAELVRELPEASFAAVLHDPPAINLAGELYSGDFYARVLRLLTRNGRFFHYIGDPRSPSGSRTTRGVVKRLHDAGFSRVTPRPEAFGVLASP